MGFDRSGCTVAILAQGTHWAATVQSSGLEPRRRRCVEADRRRCAGVAGAGRGPRLVRGPRRAPPPFFTIAYPVMVSVSPAIALPVGPRCITAMSDARARSSGKRDMVASALEATRSAAHYHTHRSDARRRNDGLGVCLHGLHRRHFGSRYTSGCCGRQKGVRDSCECHEL